jgi:hypothetical protein
VTAIWTLRLLAIEAIAMAATLTLALDMYAHKRVEALGGVNFWGYRGPVAPQRQPNEIRVALVGGTRAFGWGQSGTALVGEIRRLILLTTDQRGGELRPVVTINLGRLAALPESYPATIEHYSYLQPDYICLYDDLGVRGARSNEADSAVFALTGYTPVLPLVLREKGMVWRFSDVKRGYASAESQRAARASAVRRAAGRTLEAVADGLGGADRVMARMLRSRNRDASPRDASAVTYADAMMTAIEAAHRRARGVVVAVSPSETPEQVANARALEIQLQKALASAAWLRFVDLSTETALYDDALRVDGWNYGGTATALVAERIAPAVLSLMAKP